MTAAATVGKARASSVHLADDTLGGGTMKTSMAGLVMVLALSLPGAAVVQAQSSKASNDSTDTYVTNGGYGLGRVIPGSVDEVRTRARTTMIKLKIVEGRSRSLGQGWTELRGRKGIEDVSIQLKGQAVNSTRVEVTARRGAADYDKDLEQQLLDAIASGSSH
jgi:hypothetical protein